MPVIAKFPGSGSGEPPRIEIAAEPQQSVALTYTGSEQTPSWNNFNETELTLSGVSPQTDAGTYTAIFTPTEDYCWPGGGTESRMIPWTIDRAELPQPGLDKTSITLNDSKTSDTFTVICEGDGQITAEADRKDIAAASVAGNVVTVSAVSSENSSATITIHIGQGKNYNAYTADDLKVTVNASFLPSRKSLNDTSWEKIREVSDADQGANYWMVGDRKAIEINGTVGTIAISGTFYVYILGFDHNKAVEGTGIHFGGFKNMATGWDICLVDSHVGNYSGGGGKWFNINHWGPESGSYNKNFGGWSACDLRYDILGSTNVAPTPYGSAKTKTATGADPTSACTAQPVSGTLMAALPNDLRAVMKPMVKYTDNTGNLSTAAANVTKTIDYLPLLSEFEIFGSTYRANPSEPNYQEQYAYYSAGNSKVKYTHNSVSVDSNTTWYSRSPSSTADDYFCAVKNDGTMYVVATRRSHGLAPIFKV